MKILVAVDGSEYTRRMLEYLAAHDEWLGARHDYTLLTAVPAVPPRAGATLGRDVLDAYYTDEADKVFEPVRELVAQHGLKARFEHQIGPAADVIARTATDGSYDLIMMGTHGYGPLGRLVMGSTTTKVIAQCGVPVLLVR